MQYTIDIQPDRSDEKLRTIATFDFEAHRNVCLEALQLWFREVSNNRFYPLLVKGTKSEICKVDSV